MKMAHSRNTLFSMDVRSQLDIHKEKKKLTTSYGLNYVPQNLYVEIPLPQNVTLFEDRVFEEVINLK